MLQFPTDSNSIHSRTTMSYDVKSRDTPMAISNVQFVQLMTVITSTQNRFEDQLASVCDELQRGQYEAATKALKRVGREKPSS